MSALARGMAEDDRFLFEKIVFPHLKRAFKSLDAHCEECDAIILHPLAFLLKQQRRSALAPWRFSCFRRFFSTPPRIPERPGSPFIAEPGGRVALAYNRLALRVAAELAWVWAAPLRRFAAPPRPAPARRLWILRAGRSRRRDDCAVLAPAEMSAPRGGEGGLVAGHSFFDDPGAEDTAERARLEHFLEAGPAPIVFTLEVSS